MSVSGEPLDEELCLIIVKGRLDHNQTDALQILLQSTIDKGYLQLIVDLADVSYINSSGLRCLVSGWRQTRTLGGHLVLCGLDARITEVFSTVGFDKVFDIYGTRDEAKQRLSNT